MKLLIEENLFEGKSPSKKQENKMKKVFKEWKKGDLHIGKSKKTVSPSNKKQAIAIALSSSGLSKKINEENIAGDDQYVKDMQNIEIKLNNDTKILQDNIAKLKAQALQNLINRQKTTQVKQNTPTQQVAQQPTVKNESLLENNELILFPSLNDIDYIEDEYSYKKPYDYEEFSDDIDDVNIEVNDDKAKDDINDDIIGDEDVFYLSIDDEGNQFIVKVYKEYEDGDWMISVLDGENDTLEEMTFYSSYNKNKIINYLEELFDSVEEMTKEDYNEEVEEV